MRGTRLSSGIVAFALLATAVPSPAPAIAQDLKVLIATDERAQVVGLDMEYNRTSIERLLRSNVPQNRYVVRQVQGDSFDSGSILKAINDLNVAADDCVL